MSPEKQRRTFISYSRSNKDFALELALELRNSGFDIWLDVLDIPAGSRWDNEVEQALAECEIFMVILTPASSTSDNVKDEIGYAIDAGKRILPILLENAKVPLRLIRFQYVDFTKKSYEEGVETAKQLLRRLIDEPTIPLDQTLGETQTQIAEMETAEEETPKHDTAPFVQKREPLAAPSAKKSRLPLILGTAGAGFIVVLAIVIFALRGGSSPGSPVESANTPAPTQTPKPVQATSTLEPTVVPDTPTAEIQKYDTLEFEREEDLQSWSTVIADGRVDPNKPVITNEEFSDITLSVKDGLYFFDIGQKEKTVYSYYDSFKYEDVRVDVRVDSRNTNVNKASLICRYSPELGWYEFLITNNGPYGIYFAKPNANGQVNYRRLDDGNSPNIKPGNAINEYTIVCQGDDTLELYINGELTRSTSDALKILRTGKVGVSVWSINTFPVRVGFDWVKISEPE